MEPQTTKLGDPPFPTLSDWYAFTPFGQGVASRLYGGKPGCSLPRSSPYEANSWEDSEFERGVFKAVLMLAKEAND